MPPCCERPAVGEIVQSEVAVAAAPPELVVPPRPVRFVYVAPAPFPVEPPPPPPSEVAPAGDDPPPPPTITNGVEVSLPLKTPDIPPPELPLYAFGERPPAPPPPYCGVKSSASPP